MNITEAGVVNSPSESGTNDNPCFNDTQLKETFLMRRTTATTDYLKECMGTALLELMKEKPIEKISTQIAITSWTRRGKNLGHGWSRRIYP